MLAGVSQGLPQGKPWQGVGAPARSTKGWDNMPGRATGVDRGPAKPCLTEPGGQPIFPSGDISA